MRLLPPTSPPSCAAAPARRCGRCSGDNAIARVLVTRPEPLAGETAARLTALGHDVILSPLLVPVAVAWTPPAGPVEALLFTSPQAPGLAGAAARPYRDHPAYAVGERTAAAARAAGFTSVQALGGDVAALFAAVATRHRRVLHLAGVDRTVAVAPAGLEVVVRSVYAAEPAPLVAAARAALRDGAVDWALLFSTRSAVQFAAEHTAAGADRARLAIGAISPAALAAAGGGWRQAVAAATPTEAAILAACGLSCEKAPPASRSADG